MTVVLPPADYWRLRYLAEQAECAALKAQRAIEQAQRQLREGFDRAAAAQGFDPTLSYRFDDAMCALIPQEAAGGGQP